MNLESRVNRLERQRPNRAGRIIPIWASDEDDLSCRIEEMKRSGAMTDRDTVVVTMWMSEPGAARGASIVPSEREG